MRNVEIFSSKVAVPAGEPLGGNDPDRYSASVSDTLEVNGLAFTGADGLQYQLNALDTLYAGRLVDRFRSDERAHIFAASHTHYAPMMDDDKPQIGGFSKLGFDAFVRAFTDAERRPATLTRCRLYRAEVDVPIYRRFDYPDSWLNRLLTRNCGLYPNESRRIDKSLYLFEFLDEAEAQFVIVYHACHPVTRGATCEVSSDYIAAIRQAVRARFGVQTVIFLQGCAGDVRPNFARKRFKWLPRFRLNWRFNPSPSTELISQADDKYRHAVSEALNYREIDLSGRAFTVSTKQVSLTSGREVAFTSIGMPGGIKFLFLPFEVSHLYHLDAQVAGNSSFIVSCANATLGYLSHPAQHAAGGYEVDGSLTYMGLTEKPVIAGAI